MKLQDFKLERYFAKYEFKAPYLLCCSDCESVSLGELLQLEEGAEARFNELWLGYTESQGSPELKKEIAGLYGTIGDDEVLVHAGAEEAIFNFMNVVLEPDDHIIVQFPCYQSLFEVARAIGCRITKWELKENNGWETDLASLKDAITEKTKAVIINSPHNPTGHLLTRNELEEIVATCRKNGIILFSDEVYRYLEYNEEDRLPAACDIYENAVSLGVMSKSFGLPGLRIGWIATKNREIFTGMASFKDYTSICNSAPSEFLAELALRNKQVLLDRNMEIIRRNLGLLDEFFSRYDKLFAWNRPKAGPVAFVRLKEDIDAEDFCIDLVNEKGVLLLPGNYYDFGNKYFRIGYGRRNLEECLNKFEEYLQER